MSRVGSADLIKDLAIHDTNGAMLNGKRVRKEESTNSSRKRPKCTTVSSNIKNKPIRLKKKVFVRATKKDCIVENEADAISLTTGCGNPQPKRRLTDFVFLDKKGKHQSIEMLEVGELFVSGVVLSLEPEYDIRMEGVRCEGFSRIESWTISGYEDGSPVIWVSTDLACYDCVKPAVKYEKVYDLFYEKARACVEVYKQVCRTSGGNPDICLNQLIARVVRAMMKVSKNFGQGAMIKNFLITHGEFIYNQLIALEANKGDQRFAEVPALIALRDECKRTLAAFVSTIGVMKKDQSDFSGCFEEAKRDERLARLLREEESWRSMKKMKNEQHKVKSSKRYSIKINENVIANDYPLPVDYKPSCEEIDEYTFLDNTIVCDPDNLPKGMLHNWSLYNSSSWLTSLELLPMKPCDDTDVTIFGSGITTNVEGSGNSAHYLASSALAGTPIYLSLIKEWKVKYGKSMISISIRTDMAWYRLGKPSQQYGPWYERVMKIIELSVSIISLLKEERRIARLSFSKMIKKLCELADNHPAYISSNPKEVQRYVAVHGHIILQLFVDHPEDSIKNSVFIKELVEKMECQHNTECSVKNKKTVTRKAPNSKTVANRRASIKSNTLMRATTTRLINRIWGEFYSDSSPGAAADDEAKEESNDFALQNSLTCSQQDIKWLGEATGKTCKDEDLYRHASICGELVSIGGCVFIKNLGSEKLPKMCLVEYMFENFDGEKMVHGRLMVRASQTILANVASKREVFMTKDCLEFELEAVKQTVMVEIRQWPWGFQHRKSNADAAKIDREMAVERKKKGLPVEYYCKSLYSPERGAFLRLPTESIGMGNGICCSCRMKESLAEKESFKLNNSNDGFRYGGTNYKVGDCVYVQYNHIAADKTTKGTFINGGNVGLKPYVICQLLEILPPISSRKVNPKSVEVKVQRFYRPEDISSEKAYHSDIREIYYSEQVHVVRLACVEGKCVVRKKFDTSSMRAPAAYGHVFICELSYDPNSGAIKQLPSNKKLSSSQDNDDIVGKKEAMTIDRLATLDIFAGCGGLSEGFEKSGVSETKWAIEYEQPAGEAFKLNHPWTTVFIENCNVILRAIMSSCGDESECISTPQATMLAGKLDEQVINDLPRPGQVDFINGGPPCQGFSKLNSYSQGEWSEVQCEMILSFLSFADYFRPRYFLLENVRNFVAFNKGQTFRLTVASLLEMGYQVRYGILEAGAFGIAQSRKRAFIWAASPNEILPEWPEPMHVFATPELKIALHSNLKYAAVRSTSTGAPFRSLTVRDTIGDLPAVGNGASKDKMEYKSVPISWFQKIIRGDMVTITDHISKKMNELNLIRCKRIPKRPGADWHDLPESRVCLSNGDIVELIPKSLQDKGKDHNQWKGLFGRLDWEGNFPTILTDPQPSGKVGMCFHPEQDRIVTVRECARSQGFPDTYKFFGRIHSKHKQIGNAVPPPLAFVLGSKLKEAIELRTQDPAALEGCPYL